MFSMFVSVPPPPFIYFPFVFLSVNEYVRISLYTAFDFNVPEFREEPFFLGV